MSTALATLKSQFGRWLHLSPGDFGRLCPFFVLYTALFGMLAVGDAVSTSLFVQRAGSHNLPWAYGVTALLNVLAVGGYMWVVPRVTSRGLLRGLILLSALLFLGAWGVIHQSAQHPGGANPLWVYGTLFACRELSFTLLLTHFGNFLQEYFSKQALNRVLPIIYSGGRLGGVLGGAMVAVWAGVGPVLDLVLVYAVAGLVCVLLLQRFKVTASALPPQQGDMVETPEVPFLQAVPGDSRLMGVSETRLDAPVASFWQFMRRSRYFQTLCLSTVLFMVCRWLLNYDYSQVFNQAFGSEQSMAQALGWYTTVAMGLALGIQLFGVNRLIARFGLGWCFQGYNTLVLVMMTLCLLPQAWPHGALVIALFSRFVETELRMGFRNPLSVLMGNHYPRAHRPRARAVTIGGMIPLATFLASGLLLWLQHAWPNGVPWVGVGLAVLMVVVGQRVVYELKKLN
jgi:ATP/ADP translocase